MIQDIYDIVINNEENYKEIAKLLEEKKSVLIAWTDGDYTQLDILFTLNPVVIGPIQGGLKPDYLYVSIMRVGAFAFEVNVIDTYPSYYQEKFGGGLGSTQDQIADLINGVKRYLS